MSIKKCSLCGNLINYEREEEYQAHRRGCQYRIIQQAGQEGTYLGTAGRGIQRQQEYDQKCEENYRRLKLMVVKVVEATRSEVSSRETWDNLRIAQEELKRTQPLQRNQRDELWNLLQEGFANEKRKHEARQRRSKDNYSRLWQQINGLAQEVNTTTDWRSTRERLKSTQQALRETELLREDREALRNWIQQLFETLGKRQDAIRQQYENECATNYNRMHSQVSAACETARYGSDFRAVSDALKSAQNSLKEIRPMKREQKDELFQRLQDSFQILQRRREEYRQQKEREHQQKQREWESRQRERISNLEGAMARLEESRRNDGFYLQDLWKKMHAVKPGRRADDIRRDLNRKIEEVGARISDKARKLSEMSRDLQRMKDELRR